MKKQQKEAKKNKTEKEKSEEVVNDQQNLKEDAEQDSKEGATSEPELSKEETLEAELAEAKDKYLRLYSEFDNYRRRTSKEKLEMMQTAGEQIIVSLLPVIDDFNRAEQSFESGDAKAIIEGVKLISDKFVKILDGEGLKLMDTKEGADFDTELHDAITKIPAPSKKLKGKIVDTIENGYYLGDKVIRHAKVVIGA